MPRPERLKEFEDGLRSPTTTVNGKEITAAKGYYFASAICPNCENGTITDASGYCVRHFKCPRCKGRGLLTGQVFAETPDEEDDFDNDGYEGDYDDDDY